MEGSGSGTALQLSQLSVRGGGVGRGTGKGRAVSPVIGIVLMLAVTISLAMLVVPLVFTVAGGTADSAPSASFSYSYTEAVGGTVQDDFGQTGSNADGMLRIDLKTGDDIDASQLEVSAAVSGGNWVDDTDPSVYDVGETASPGDSISVWANRGERVEVIWTDSAGKNSEILAEFTVAPSVDGVPPGAPSPDDDCDYLSDPNHFDTSGTKNVLEIDGDVVQCDLDEYPTDVHNLTLTNGGALIGEAATIDEVNLLGGSLIWGDVDTDSVVLLDDATINGMVRANTEFVSNSSEVDGRVRTGRAKLEPGSTIRLRLRADFKVTLNDSRVGGDVIGDDDVVLDNESVVAQDVELDPSTSELRCEDGDLSTIGGQGCLEYSSPNFQVDIDDTSEPVEENEEFNATVEVTNEGYDAGSQTIELLVDGIVEDSQSVDNLDAGNSQTPTLRWPDAPKGNYSVEVRSDDDSVSSNLRVYATGEAPREFEFLNVTTTVSSDELTEAVFEWETDRTANVTVEVTKGGTTEDSETIIEESTNTTTLNSLSNVALPAFIRANIHNGECYEYEIKSGETDTEYDLIDDGWRC